MSLFSKLRAKPRRVRERYLMVAMLVVAAALFVVWFLTYHYDASTSGTDFFKSVGSSVTNSFNSPVYDGTFGGTSLKTPKLAIPTPPAASTSTPVSAATSTPVTP